MYLFLTPGPAQTWQHFEFQIWYMLPLKSREVPKDSASLLVVRDARDNLYFTLGV